MKKLMIAAVSSGSGKTTITLGLMKLLQNRGYRVQPYKVGPDYVDTEYHTRITGNPSRNLDMFLVQDNARMKTLFEKEAGNADICVIEGVMGLFDGLGGRQGFLLQCRNCKAVGLFRIAGSEWAISLNICGGSG